MIHPLSIARRDEPCALASLAGGEIEPLPAAGVYLVTAFATEGLTEAGRDSLQHEKKMFTRLLQVLPRRF